MHASATIKQEHSKNGLHMHQCVHNYKVDFVGDYHGLLTISKQALESFQMRIISSSTAQHSLALYVID